MMFKIGDKVKFSRGAKHLKSYDKDAVGHVIHKHYCYDMKGYDGKVSVSWTRKDGSKFATTCISEDKIQPYGGAEYKPSNETKQEPEMTLDKAVKELSEARDRVAELEKFITERMTELGIEVSFGKEYCRKMTMKEWGELKSEFKAKIRIIK